MAKDPLTARMVDHQLVADAQQMEAGGDHAGALAAYLSLIKKYPLAADLYFAAAHAAHSNNRHMDGLRYIRRALELDPNKAHFHALYGMLLTTLSKVDEGLGEAERAMELNPADPFGANVRAELLRVEGRSGEAIEMLEARFEGDPTADPRLAFTYGQLLAGVGRASEGIEILKTLSERTDVPRMLRSRACFQLGRLLDKAKRWDEAFEAVRLGSELRGAIRDPEGEDRRLQGRMELWTRERLAQTPHSRVQTELPVFILGMPRSGTTLTEQIIGSHPEAYGAGERPNIIAIGRELFRGSESKGLAAVRQGVVDRITRRELRDLQKLDRDAKRITDKLPQNFLHLGLIELIFPTAKIIHCRRDPMDNCLSCYFQDFGGRENQSYSYDLGHLGHYYRNYVTLMEHWKSVTSLPILELQYEEMVGDQEAMSRRVIDFIGLEWDDACLQFHKSERKVVTLSHEQVRQPMYTSSVKRWKHYERHLGALREALGDLVED